MSRSMIPLDRMLNEVRQRPPLVHNITNYVVMNTTANALLAVGASPVMAHAIEEVREMTGLADALVLNIGTLSASWIRAMLASAAAARKRRIPVVLDPVGAGATRFRTRTALRLLATGTIAIVRANASEILALDGQKARTRGVDAADPAASAHDAAARLARRHGVVVSMTGPEDFVTDGRRAARVANGHPMMGRLTGTGCIASALTAAVAARSDDPWQAAAAALALFGLAGELAARACPGPGTFQFRLLDALARIDPRQLRLRARIRCCALPG
ncbi:MAG TPA: hydroxyethylthiazole kinase [Candidatus Paceibacterota bacterium]|nr:hydroxyethylthiazole kinase [Verrucomicrobiota bacterium]HRZ45391.1 hydroxyethylthiazole kinase [Candidatus Paceibacterota bacterium]HRZ92501.1 hydroxyethylthiazole kinase [Candidatus Paceibacterota bacterium]